MGENREAYSSVRNQLRLPYLDRRCRSVAVLLASLVGSIRGMTESLFGWVRKRRMLPVKCRCHRNLSPGSRNLLRAIRCVDDGCRIRTRGIALLNVRMNERHIRNASVKRERVCCTRRTRCLLDGPRDCGCASLVRN